jgi:hypothetical protein
VRALQGVAKELIDTPHLLPVPQLMSPLAAATLPDIYASAWLNLFQLLARRARTTKPEPAVPARR